MPQPSTAAGPALLEEDKSKDNAAPAAISPEIIISKNLFDPERGAGATREAEFNSRASQRVRNMVLLGTVILGDSRSAILQDAGTPPGAPGAPAAPTGAMRVKLGDSVEGFRLTEIADRRVVFTKGATRVEVLLDYFRKTDPVPAVRAPAPGQTVSPTIVPRVVPNLPRRGALPVAPNRNPES